MIEYVALILFVVSLYDTCYSQHEEDDEIETFNED